MSFVVEHIAWDFLILTIVKNRTKKIFLGLFRYSVISRLANSTLVHDYHMHHPRTAIHDLIFHSKS